MKNCFLCGQPTKVPCYDFCDRCLNLSIEEIEDRFLKKRIPDIREEQKHVGATGDPCQSMTFYHRSKEFFRGIFFC